MGARLVERVAQVKRRGTHFTSPERAEPPFGTLAARPAIRTE